MRLNIISVCHHSYFITLEPRQLDGREASLVPGKLEGNAALPEP